MRLEWCHEVVPVLPNPRLSVYFWRQSDLIFWLESSHFMAPRLLPSPKVESSFEKQGRFANHALRRVGLVSGINFGDIANSKNSLRGE